MTWPDDATVARILAERVDRYRMTAGIVVGLINPAGRRFHAHGRLSQARPVPPDAQTVLEVGSVTKVFTALVLANMVCRGDLRLEDPGYLEVPGAAQPSGAGSPPQVVTRPC